MIFFGAYKIILIKKDFIIRKISYHSVISPTPFSAPIARIGKNFTVYSDSTIRSYVSDDLPELVFASDALYTGAVLQGVGIENVLLIIEKSKKANLAVVKVSIYNDEYIELILSNKIKVIYSSKKDPEKTVEELKKLLSILSFEATMPGKIDMRFNKPILIY